MTDLVRKLGAWALAETRAMGNMLLFLLNAVYYIIIPPFKFNILVRQIRFLGSKSMMVILLTGSFTGMWGI